MSIRDTGAASRGLLYILENNPKRFCRIRFLSKLFEVGGYELRIAGGAVRDILMGVEPKDIDFATTAKPDESLEILKKHENLWRIIITESGQKHGTVAVKFKKGDFDFDKILNDDQPPTYESRARSSDAVAKVEYDDESPYEITTLRFDVKTDGRHAEVIFIDDWRKDAERRDLTINAMFLTIGDGRLIDYFNGEQDLKKGVVKFVGGADYRIAEDRLRILRYFRFWSRYGRQVQPDHETISAIKRNLFGLKMISAERLWAETKKIYKDLPCYEATKLMLEVHLFEHIGVVDTDLKDYNHYVKRTLDTLKRVQTSVGIFTKEYLCPRLQKNPDNKSDRKISELVPVILFASVLQNSNMFAGLQRRMRLSNLERGIFMYFMENRDEDRDLNSFKYELVMAPSPVRFQLLTKIRSFLVFSGKLDYIKELDSWTIPNFPISGLMVQQLAKRRRMPILPIRTFVEGLRKRWVDSDYTIPNGEIEEELRNFMNELSTSANNDFK